jgi:hypothetical protein
MYILLRFLVLSNIIQETGVDLTYNLCFSNLKDNISNIKISAEKLVSLDKPL